MRNGNLIRRIAALTLLGSFLLLLGKFAAYFLTGSKAALSDALESIINIVTGAFVYYSVTISTRPADECHPYGHGKIEAFSAGLEGGLILLAGAVILFEAIPAFFSPEPPRQLDTGILLLLGAGLANLGLGFAVMRAGRRHRSEALVANGRHLLTDFITSGGVVIGLALVRFTGWAWVDPLVACLVAINILIPGARLLRRSFGNLMDQADPLVLQRVADSLNQKKTPAWLCPHDLRAIRSGRYHHVDLHVTLPHYWSLRQVNAVEKELSETILEAIGGEGDVMIHLDPCESSCCRCCTLKSCPERSEDFQAPPPMSVGEITAQPAENDDTRDQHAASASRLLCRHRSPSSPVG